MKPSGFVLMEALQSDGKTWGPPQPVAVENVAAAQKDLGARIYRKDLSKERRAQIVAQNSSLGVTNENLRGPSKMLAVADVLPTVGSIAGGIGGGIAAGSAGSIVPGAGTAAGAVAGRTAGSALGSGAGQALREGIYRAAGYGDAPGTVLGETGIGAATGLGGEVVGMGLRPVGASILRGSTRAAQAARTALQPAYDAMMKLKIPIGGGPARDIGSKMSESAINTIAGIRQRVLTEADKAGMVDVRNIGNDAWRALNRTRKIAPAGSARSKMTTALDDLDIVQATKPGKQQVTKLSPSFLAEQLTRLGKVEGFDPLMRRIEVALPEGGEALARAASAVYRQINRRLRSKVGNDISKFMTQPLSDEEVKVIRPLLTAPQQKFLDATGKLNISYQQLNKIMSNLISVKTITTQAEAFNPMPAIEKYGLMAGFGGGLAAGAMGNYPAGALATLGAGTAALLRMRPDLASRVGIGLYRQSANIPNAAISALRVTNELNNAGQGEATPEQRRIAEELYRQYQRENPAYKEMP